MHAVPIRGRRTAVRASVLAAVLGLAIAGCSGSAASTTSGGEPPAGELPIEAPTMAPAAPREGVAVGGPAGGDSTVGEPGTGEVGTGGSSDALGVALAPMIVRTGTLTLEVGDLDAALIRARSAVVGMGGYVSDSQRSNTGGEAIASITYRIPADRWDDALDALRGLATRLVTEDTRAVEVTGQVVDLDARISNLRTSEQALQSIMSKATRISDILEVQNQLTAVRSEIEQLVAQRTRLADEAAYATLAVTWTVPVVAVIEATEGWSLQAELDRAVAQLVQVGQGLVVLGVWLAIVVLPVVGGLALAIVLVAVVVRRFAPARRPAG